VLRKIGLIGVAAISLVALAHSAVAGSTASAPGAKVYFVDIKNGDTVKSPLTIHFGISGMTIAPAGTETPNTGHHHLLIDAQLGGDAVDQPIPADEHHVHFGKGQTEATVTLKPGTHTLQLVLGDWSHVPHNPPVVSDVITIHVE